MTLPVRFINHACVAISPEGEGGGGEILLTDPWFSGEVFNRSWNLLIDGDWSLVDWPRVRHIWISHEHPDHLNFPTLKEIRNRVTGPGPLTLYYRAQKNKNVKEALEKMGFAVVELLPEVELRISDKLAITTYWRGQDTAAVIRCGEFVIVNQNDCQLKNAVARRLKRDALRRYGCIDLLLFQFSLAGYYANADDPEGLRRARENHLAMIERYVGIFEPRVYVPFASFVYFCKTANCFLNDWAVPLDEVAALSSLGGRVQVCTPGDVVQADAQDASAQAQRIAYWRELFKRERHCHAPRETGAEALLAAGRQFVAEVAAVAPRWLRPGKTAYFLDDMAQYLILDYRGALCDIKPELGGAVLAGTLPTEELLFFLRFPWGADTLNITSAFNVADKLAWKRTLYLKHLLYVVRSRWTRKLIAPAAWVIAVLRT